MINTITRRDLFAIIREIAIQFSIDTQTRATTDLENCVCTDDAELKNMVDWYFRKFDLLFSIRRAARVNTAR